MKLIKRILQIILGIICITPFALVVGAVGAGIYFMLRVFICELLKTNFMEWLICAGILVGFILVIFLVTMMLADYGWGLISRKKK